jgi:hypothetical protein
VVTDVRKMLTPTSMLATLYSEYDGLLEELETVQRELKAKRGWHLLASRTLRRQRYDLCEALADVHEKIADYDLVIM